MDAQQRADYEATLELVTSMVDGAFGAVVSGIERQEKLRWLEEFVNTPLAWNVAVELLSGRSSSHQIFAADALTKKVSSSWSSLLKEHKKELCDVVLSALGDPNTSPNLRSALCKTITHIILQSTPHDWPDPVSDTLYLSQPDSSLAIDTRSVWITLVKILAEEAGSSNPGEVTKQQHEIVKKYLKDASADHVIKVLLAIIEENCLSSDSTLAHDALQAMEGWYDLNPDITSTTSQTIDLVVSCMLTSPNLLARSGSDVIVAVLNLFNLARYPTVVQHILVSILRLGELIPGALQDEDEDILQSVQTVFTTFGSNLSSYLLKEPQHGVRVCEIIVGCCQIKDCINSSVTDFWSDLNKELSADPDFEDLLDEFRAPILKMVQLVLEQCRRPEEDDIESEEELRHIREEGGEMIRSYYSMVPEEELEMLQGLLVDNLSLHQRQPTTDNESWIEVALWGWSILTEEFADEEEWPLKLMRLFPDLPQTILIQKTAIQFVGKLAHWLATHHAAIPTALSYIITSLENVDLADAATYSLSCVCDQCGEALPPLLAELLDQLENVTGALTPKQQCQVISCLANQVTFLHPSEALSLLARLAGTLPENLLALTQETNHFNLLEKARLMDGLNVISALLVSPGDPMETQQAPDQHVLVSHCRGPAKKTASESYLEQVEWARVALVPLVESTWPIAEAIVNGVDLDEEFCIPVINYIGRVSSSLKRFVGADYMGKALTLLVNMFGRTGSVKIFRQFDVFCGVYRTVYSTQDITRLIPEEHGHIVELGLVPPAPSASIENPPCHLVSQFGEAFSTFSNLALQLLQAGTGAEEIELIQYYYHHCVTPTLLYLPRAFFADVDCVVAVSQFASNVLPALHRAQELRHMMRFLRYLFTVDVSTAMTPQECAEFQGFKADLFEVMLANIFLALGGPSPSPRTLVGSFAEAVHFFLVTFPSLTMATLDSVLSRPDFPNPNVAVERKQEFLSKIKQATRSKETMSAVLHNFSVVCRGLESTFLASVVTHQHP